jgi:hypothetical protein
MGCPTALFTEPNGTAPVCVPFNSSGRTYGALAEAKA